MNGSRKGEYEGMDRLKDRLRMLWTDTSLELNEQLKRWTDVKIEKSVDG